jgi:rubrerythrin
MTSPATTPTRPAIKTMANLEAAFAGESMAHIKYRYFAKLCRAMGDEATALAFEATADQEVQHAFGHLDLLYPKTSMTPAKALQIAIDGETYEYTEMYPGFRQTALAEGNAAAAAEMTEQIAESKVHATQFAASLVEAKLAAAAQVKTTLEKAQKRFAALTKVEERHANHYKARLASLAAQ